MKTDEQMIRDIVGQWHRSTAVGDVETVLSLMSSDVMFLVAGKPPMKGRSSFEKGVRNLLRTHRVDSTGEIEECVVSGDLAYCLTRLTVRITPVSGGDASVRVGSALSIFRKQANGAWQLTRDANLLPPAA